MIKCMLLIGIAALITACGGLQQPPKLDPKFDLAKGSRNTTVYPDATTGKEIVVYDLTGDWDADYAGGPEIVRITQTGPQFEGIKTIGNQFIGRGGRTVQGRIQGSSIQCSVETVLGPVSSTGRIYEDGDKFDCVGRSTTGSEQTVTYTRRR